MTARQCLDLRPIVERMRALGLTYLQVDVLSSGELDVIVSGEDKLGRSIEGRGATYDEAHRRAREYGR